MTKPSGWDPSSLMPSAGNPSVRRPRKQMPGRSRLLVVFGVVGGFSLILVGAAVWVTTKAATIKSELEATALLIPQLKTEVIEKQEENAAVTFEAMRAHANSARQASEDPLWAVASVLPVLGQNFSATSEIARSTDDVTNLGIGPLIGIYEQLSWSNVLASGSETDLLLLKEAAPKVTAAAHAVRVSSERLQSIDTEGLFPEVATPLNLAKQQLASVTDFLDASASGSQLLPQMLGLESPRNYLLMIQNNAESRSSGGIPGALAVLTVSNGQLKLGAQDSASDLGAISPPLAVDDIQEQIFTSRLGKYMQDVNLTPDFPTAATTAQRMWERKTGQRLDGVVSVDPIALAYVLEVMGPVQLKDPELVALAGTRLPTALSSSNVVPTLLSEVYAAIEQPTLQDAYFAGVANEIFTTFSEDSGNAKGLMDAIIRAASEGRILLWSASKAEQSVIANYPVSGSIAGPSISPAQFGVYFNDGTGAKMDFYVKRTVQLIKECPRDGYEEVTVRVTSTNTAPGDAATSLPQYVTGGGAFGVPAGSVQTNIVTYGPVQANVEAATVDGHSTNFSSFEHSNRPVGTLAVRLAPGESSTVDFTFAKIVQHTEPSVVVTPTVQDAKEVIQITQSASCG